MQDIKDNPVLNTTDLLFIVGGIYGGVSMPELLEYVKGLDATILKCSVLVTSCASGKQKQIAVRSILEEKGIKVIGEFICKGAILFVSGSHPNQKDLTDVKNFAVRMVSEV